MYSRFVLNKPNTLPGVLNIGYPHIYVNNEKRPNFKSMKTHKTQDGMLPSKMWKE